MNGEAGGRANLGYTELDQKNYLRTRRQKSLIYGEAGYLLRMIIDYAYFGDVMTLDTTYGTNKELRPLVVFTGFNHHRRVVIFWPALLYDETVESFKWLFENFLDAHGGKKPQTIFTDQEAAMAKALTEVMPDTWHGLCTWHIMQNCIKYLGNLMKDGSHFLRDFKSCMFEYEDETEFENAWKKMIQRYNGGLVSWLDCMYKLKTKLAKCHMKNAFTLGVRSTQLNESLNGDLKAYLKSNFGIVEFFQHFEQVVEQKRHKALETENNARQKMSTLGLKNSPLLKHAAQTYTPVIFEKIHDEYDYTSAMIIKHCNESQFVHEYIVALYEKDKEYKVIFNRDNKIILCSCMKFETFGILCCHALKVFNLLDIKIIPDTYILKRWTREAKSGHIYVKTKNVEEDRIEQVPYSVPMITSEKPFGDRPEIGFNEFLQVTDEFNLTPTVQHLLLIVQIQI
ncbi:protein FAR1-RELATED SEQUENCE 5-like [Corylus avellana]|uniref:protein FAR1-RELATED SEQUENCE 5-like n=1 Tax=Corylus avellana TaxID=13451 RepID=UPI00286D1710|nr:protein FAR1-RELATED SEQUENCE 5-like [Corylus avellana]